MLIYYVIAYFVIGLFFACIFTWIKSKKLKKARDKAINKNPECKNWFEKMYRIECMEVFKYNTVWIIGWFCFLIFEGIERFYNLIKLGWHWLLCKLFRVKY